MIQTGSLYGLKWPEMVIEETTKPHCLDVPRRVGDVLTALGYADGGPHEKDRNKVSSLQLYEYL